MPNEPKRQATALQESNTLILLQDIMQGVMRYKPCINGKLRCACR